MTMRGWMVVALWALVACGESPDRSGGGPMDDDDRIDEGIASLFDGGSGGVSGGAGGQGDAGMTGGVGAAGMAGEAGAGGVSSGGTGGSGGGTIESGGTGGDADAAVDEVPCDDADSDGVCDLDDVCPAGPDDDADANGYADACDSVLWAVSYPIPGGPIHLPDARGALVVDAIGDPPASSSASLPVPQGAHETDADESATARLKTLMLERIAVSGVVGVNSGFMPVDGLGPSPAVMTTFASSGPEITRIVMESRYENTYLYSLRWTVRGYANP